LPWLIFVKEKNFGVGNKKFEANWSKMQHVETGK
jgi:hypothetical protein